MSSDILWRPFDVSPFGLIYAGAQKNLGPAGVTLVIVRDDLLEQASVQLPTMLKYATHAAEHSLYNTPPCFAIYLVRHVLRWVKAQGGLPAMEAQNRRKAELLYGAIDASGGFYRNPVEKGARSVMNVVFRLPNEELEAKFVADGKQRDFIGLKGHRSVGGIRVSMYNACSVNSIQALTAFMEDFQARNG
jgi:phosphoserine aminotransferase